MDSSTEVFRSTAGTTIGVAFPPVRRPTYKRQTDDSGSGRGTNRQQSTVFVVSPMMNYRSETVGFVSGSLSTLRKPASCHAGLGETILYYGREEIS